MSDPMRLTGLISGMDTDSMVANILEMERIPMMRKENEIFQNENELLAWSELDSQVSTLDSKVSQLDSYTTWRQKAVSSDDEDIVTATADRTAGTGTYEVTISDLAKSHRIASDAQTDATSDLNLSGEFTIGGETVTVDTTDSLTDIRDAINTAALNMDAGEKVEATIIDSTLVLERDQAGATDISLSDTSGTVLEDLGVLDTGAVKNELVAGQDLAGTVNGVAISASENTGLEDILEGVTLNFHDTGTTSFTVSNDTATIKSLLQEFITAYNDTMELAEDQSAVDLTSSASGEETISSVGILQGDSTLYEIRNKMRSIATSTDDDTLDADYNSLSKIGIWTTGENNRLAIVDEAKLDDALANHFDEVEDLLRESDVGIMDQFADYTDSLVSPLTGRLDSRQLTLQEKNADLQEEIDEFDANQVDREQDLYERFGRMEEMMASLQAQAGRVLSSLGTS